MARLRRTVRDWLRVSLSAGIGDQQDGGAHRGPVAQAGGAACGARRAGKRRSWRRCRWAGFPGWARRLRSTLEVAGLATMGELARAPIDALQLVLGRGALALQRRAQGVDEEPVRPKPAGGSKPQGDARIRRGRLGGAAWCWKR